MSTITEERLSPRRRLLVGLFFLLMGAAGFAVGRVGLRPAKPVSQPMAFDHRLHVEEAEIECDTCHEHVTTGEHAGLPSFELCLDCHEEPESDAEARVVELAAAGTASFKKLFRMPDHVYYTHRRHVGVAQLDCEQCHGAIASTVAPPETPLVRITMDTCIDCHRREGVRSSCTACHR